MKLKIALMIFSATIGGAESVVIKIAERLDKDKYDIYVVTNDEIAHAFSIDNVKLYSVGKLYSKNILFRGIKKVISSELYTKLIMSFIKGRLQKHLISQEIDVIHSHLLYDHYLNSILQCSKSKKVMTIHGTYGLHKNGCPTYSAKTISVIHKSADIVTSACQYFGTILNNIGINMEIFRIIENGIDFNMIEKKKKEEINDGKINMVYLGGTRIIKGWDILVGALDIAVNVYGITDIHLDVLRDVPIESDFYQQVKQNGLLDYITFNGYVSDNSHLSYMSKCNIYILPSYSEGIANTLVEAIGLQKCVLATGVGGTPELIKHMENGYLCDTTSSSLAEGIKFFHENKNKINEFARKNAILGKELDWNNVIKSYDILYEEMCSKD